MSPKDKNMLDTLNLLVLLYRTKKNPLFNVSEDEQVMLPITEEHLQMSGLTLPVFLNALDMLGTKGYALHISPFTKEARKEIERYKASDDFSKVMAIISTHDTTKLNVEMKEALSKDIQKVAPKDMTLDADSLMSDDSFTVENLLREANKRVLAYTPDTIATVMLLPFRSIERLLEKMNSGMKFDEVQDAGIWYDPRSFEFHFNGKAVSTAYNNNPSLIHYILSGLFNESQDSILYYEDCSEFSDKNDQSKENKKFADATRGFIAKDSELSKIFDVHADRLEVRKEHWDDTH